MAAPSSTALTMRNADLRSTSMKYWIALAMISLSIAVNADARQLEYDLDVKGMKCAFCAYNVSKQLESLAGVVPGTVDVDL